MKLKNSTGTKRTIKRLPTFTYLAYILAATVVFTGVTFSGYISTTSGSNVARVAKFEITETIDSSGVYYVSADLYPGTYKDTKIIVKNTSEVVVDYMVSVANVSNALPLEFFVYEDENKDGEWTEGENIVATPFTKTMEPSDQSTNYTLRVSWPAQENSAAYAGMKDIISITLDAVQKD